MFTPRKASILSKRRTSTSGLRPRQSVPKSDLQELDAAITRIEELIQKICTVISEAEGVVSEQSAAYNSQNRNGFSSLEKNQKSLFIPISAADEEELVELLRRTAELVIQGERRASAIGTHGLTESLPYNSSSAKNYNDVRNKTTKLDQHQNQPFRAKDTDEKEKERLLHSSLFDLFLERNVLSTTVSLVTGASFQHVSRETTYSEVSLEGTLGNRIVVSENDQIGSTTGGGTEPTTKNLLPSNNTQSRKKVVFLPPISVATQAVQSTAILIQNVSQATSLYMLLSNNRVNDLIGLPLDLYAYAFQQRECIHFATSPALMENTRQSAGNAKVDIPEIAELATHFVSFLKSLVVRINLETLQFYIRYASDPRIHVSSKNDGLIIPSTDSPVTPSSSTLKGSDMLNDVGVDFLTEDIEFPLYARALEFCNTNQDSFVRLTAMNICLNTLRLAASSSHSEVWNEKKEPYMVSKSPKRITESVDLPFRERIAIAQHICHPDRVQLFIRPIFCRLEYLVGAWKDSFHAIESKNTKDFDVLENIEFDPQTIKITGAVEDIAIDMQDELLLLDDVLKMGLTPLNEQIIEMMLSTYIYPVLLQPLSSTLDTESVYERAAEESDNHDISVKAAGKQLNSLNPAMLKSSFLGLYSVFNTITNIALLRTVFAALFHPKTFDKSCSIVIKPYVVTGVGTERQLKVDASHDNCILYDFGRSHLFSSNMDGKGCCTFAFSPSLSSILDNMGITKTCPNMYRELLLECMAGKNGTDLQKAAVLPFAAAVEALGEFAEDILFGHKGDTAESSSTGEMSELGRSEVHRIDIGSNSSSDDFETNVVGTADFAQMGNETVVKLLASLTSCVVSSTDCVNGVWKLDYNKIAGRALLRVISQKPVAMQVTSKLLKHRKQKSAHFLSQLPALVDVGFVEKIKTAGPLSISENQDDQQLNLIMDRIVRDSWGGREGCILDFFVRKEMKDGAFALCVIIAAKCSLTQACKDVVASRKIVVSEGMEAAMSCAADSALAHFQLDALSDFASNNWSPSKLFFVEDTQISSISSKLKAALCYQHDETFCDERLDYGDEVDLVGKDALPCVCEVNKESQSLFTDQRACVVADGVRWQSLYLVFLNRYMLLVEPVKQGLGGSGRIVTFCYLGGLKVSKDKAPALNSQFSARRLILRHESMDPVIPGVFSCRGVPRGSVMIRSRMDLWFENDESANTALEAFVAKIYHERGRRGGHLRYKLIEMSNQ